QEPDAVVELRYRVEVQPGLRGDVEHPVVGGDQQPSIVGEPGDELLDHAVDENQLGAPGLGVDAAQVSGEVELRDVAVDQCLRRGGQRAEHEGDQVAVADRAGVGGAAIHRTGQPGARVGVRAD